MPRPKRVYEYDEYVIKILARKGVRKLLTRHKIKEVKLPKIYATPTCGINTAGQTWIYKTGESDIELSSWILVSKYEVKRVIRHEMAHVLKTACKLEGRPHGKVFNNVLKSVCPITWRKDKHWYTSTKIDAARKIHHPRLKETGVDNPQH